MVVLPLWNKFSALFSWFYLAVKVQLFFWLKYVSQPNFCVPSVASELGSSAEIRQDWISLQNGLYIFWCKSSNKHLFTTEKQKMLANFYFFDFFCKEKNNRKLTLAVIYQGAIPEAYRWYIINYKILIWAQRFLL